MRELHRLMPHGQGPATHVLAIGVGAYPHLKDGSGARSREAGQMGQLTSPPVSADAIANWFRGPAFRNASAPIGSVEILRSSNDQSEQPTYANIKRAVQDWYTRAHSHLDNLAIFYFCGHGVSKGIHDGLLAADFGENDLSLLEHALNIDALQVAMDGCRARQQCFFVDACRNTPSFLDSRDLANGIGVSPIDPPPEFGKHGPLDGSRFYAARPTEQAYGREKKTSFFTEALIEALNGGGAFRTGAEWQVRTEYLLGAINALLDVITKREGHPPIKAMQDQNSSFVLHQLAGPPEVSVSIACRPGAAMAEAALAIETTESTRRREERATASASPWELRWPAGSCTVSASFPSGRYKNVSHVRTVWPPLTPFELDV